MNNAPDVETLFAHGPFVEAVVRRLLRDEALAEDVLQETWLAALRAPVVLRSARAWLRRVATNLARRAVRERLRRERRERVSAADAEGTGGSDVLLAKLESHRHVVEAVAALEPAYRTVILLRFYEDLAPREIARRTGENASTVRTRLQRALGMLRVRLDRRHGGDGRTWVVALLPLLRPPAAASAIGGTVVMKKLVACVALLLLAIAGWVSYAALAPRGASARQATAVTVQEVGAADVDAPGGDVAAPEVTVPEPPGAPAETMAPASENPGACVALVRLDDESPLRDAILSVGNDPKLRGTTDAEGRLRIAGEWAESRELMLQAADGSWRMTTGAYARMGNIAELTLERGITVTTTVVARDDWAPVPNARVVLGREDLARSPGQAQGVWAVADANGRVRIEFLPRALYRYEVIANGFEGVLGIVDLSRATLPDRFELAPARILTVRFEDLAPGNVGKEVAGFVQRSGGGMPRRFRERLDERGEIRIPAPPVGGYGLVIEAGEVAPQLTATLVITEGELAPVVIQVPSGASWTCVVHRADGTEWSDHAIRVDGIGGDATTARTDEHGFVRIPVLKRGRKTVVGMIRDGWFSIGTIDVPERGTLHSDLRLPGRAALRARVVRDGKPVRVPLVLCLQSDPDVYAYQIPDGDGRVAMDDLAAGSYALETRGDSIARLRTVALRDGDTVDLGDLDLGAASSVRVEVVVPEGAKMPKGFHAYATIAGLDGKAREQVALVWLDEQGRGVVADLPAGTHKVRVSTPGFTDAEVVLAVPSTEPVKIALEPSVQVGR